MIHEDVAACASVRTLTAALSLSWVALSLSTSGCSAGPFEADGAVDAADAGPPYLPVPPSWGTCPDGWAMEALDPSDATAGGATVCAPPPRARCSGATFQRVGEAACENVDDGCAPGAFRDGDPGVLVDAAAAPGGDGSPTRPYATLDDAIASGASAVSLAAGDYHVTQPLASDLVLRGVCADRVRLVAMPTRPALVVPPGVHASITGVTVSGAGLGLLAGGSLALDRVVVEDVGGWGVAVNLGTLSAERVLVRSVRAAESAGEGAGFAITEGASVVLRDVVVEDTRSVGMYVDDEASLDAERTVVQQIEPDAMGYYGGGIGVSRGSRLDLRHSTVAAVRAFGVALVEGSTANLDAVVLMDLTAAPGTPACKALDVRDSVGTLTRVAVRGSDGVGLNLYGSAEVTASDLSIRDLRVSGDFASGILLEGGRLELQRAMLLDTAYVGVYLRGGELSANDLVVRRVSWAPDAGSALAATVGGVCTVRRFSFTDLLVRGAAAIGEGSQISLEQGEIRGVRGPGEDIGRAIEASEGGVAVVRSVDIHDAVETGILASGLTALGLFAVGTRIELTDVRVSGIRERECAATTCSTEAGGTGVASLYGASVVAEGLVVNGTPLCGVQVAQGGGLDLSGGTVEGCAIGACVAIEGYDLARVVGSTRYVDNERNVETRGVYVPPRGPSF